MRRHRAIAIATLGLAAALAAPAAAHVQVTPSAVAPGDPVTFEVLVPGETDARTVEVSLQVPDGVLPFAYEDVPGWRRTLEPAPNGSVRVIRWRGRMAPDGFTRFSVLAGTPEREGDLVWKAVQRYDDGEEAAWIGAPDSDNPAPVTTVSASAPRQNAGGEGAEAAQGGSDAVPAPAATSADDDDASTLGIVLGGAGLVLGAVALAVALRRRRGVPA